MGNPNFPCNQTSCDSFNIENRLCNSIGEVLLSAGAAGYFEVSPCPMVILTEVLNGDNEKAKTIR